MGIDQAEAEAEPEVAEVQESNSSDLLRGQVLPFTVDGGVPGSAQCGPGPPGYQLPYREFRSVPSSITFSKNQM